MEQFYTVDKYYITEMFYNVLGLAVNIIDKKHVFILRLVKYTKLLFPDRRINHKGYDRANKRKKPPWIYGSDACSRAQYRDVSLHENT